MSTILIVDDEESVLAVTAAILEKRGYTTIQAKDVENAERLIALGGVDLVLVDVVIPGRGGLDLLMRLRAEHPKLPVVVMSGKIRTNTDPFRTLAEQFGARCILPKPFTADELTDSVASVLNQSCN